MIQGKLPPQGSKYAYRWIDRSKGAAPVDHYVLLDATEAEIGTSDEATSYDPRPRLWYRRTVEEKSLLITDPDVFAALGLIGFTVAAPFYADGKIAGVAAADITLDGLSEYLSENKISPGTVSYILDDHGGVIANSERAKTYTSKNGRVELQHVTSLDNELPAIAYGSRPRHGETLFAFSRGGSQYVASLATLPPQFGKQWQLFIITPLHDFTSAFDKHNNQVLVFGLLAIAAQILIIYFLSSVVSSPLERLSLKVARIETLEAGHLPPLDSPIREISVLSKAVDTLDTTIKSFAAFVPVGLVRQLLQSDQKLELGGHSQFLTVFFSDLEAFSDALRSGAGAGSVAAGFGLSRTRHQSG
jgi:adenylate cyclase